MIPDLAQRRQAIEETHRSFLVEASAGTGKTNVLIRRILHTVLEHGPGGEPLPLARICAITFTEKAAGEMKVRLRHEFESAALAGGDRGARARQALLDLESAAISTIHAFAVSLLKERPVEAGLDPRFTVLDEIQSELLFLEVWEAWLQRAIEERRAALENALRARLGLEALRSAARALRHHARDVRRLRLPPPPTEEEARAQITELLEYGRHLQGLAVDPSDKLLALLVDACAWLAKPEGPVVPGKPGNKGTARGWREGKDTVEAAREFVRNVVDYRGRYLLFPVKRILDAVLRLIIGEFLPEWEAHKRARGLVDFDDMLGHARDLLRSSRAAREDLRLKYSVLLVDEFQDTDATQWEMVRLLVAGEEEGSAPGEGPVSPGRLFVVGDPKQSIYRFRGADIETYLDVSSSPSMMSLGLAQLSLTTNFRSVPSILSFADELFGGVMKKEDGKPYQPDYLAFGGRGVRGGLPGAPCVHLLGDRDNDGNFAGSGHEFVAVEARRIAALIASMRVNPEWRVEVADGSETIWRPPRFRDMAILLPVLTQTDALESELRDAGIPYVLEGGKFYYARSEVSSALTVLRAVSNPNDAVALYGALRSVFFGVSDEDLLRANIQGLPLDYRCDVPSDSVLNRPYGILRELHLHRHDRTASETLERLLHRTGAREVLAVRGVQSIANLNKLVRTLRALQQDATFYEVVEMIAGMDEEGMAESESRIMEDQSDAIRVLSIHRAKGLDFPIVIVAGLGIQRRLQHAEFLADIHESGVFGLNLGSKESGLQTHGWAELAEAEKAKEGAELVRQLYVALTRARDHLVISTHVRGRWAQETERWAANYSKTRLEPFSSSLEDLFRREPPFARFIDNESLPTAVPPAPAGTSIPKLDAPATLAAQYSELRRLLLETPEARIRRAASAGAEQERGEEEFHDFARERAVRIGTAFHQVMETADLRALSAVEGTAREAGAAQRLDENGFRTVKEMLDRTLGSDMMSRVRNSLQSGKRVWRELPYVRPLGTDHKEIEEGKIDLLFEEEEGWVLVDYKTDVLPEGNQDPRNYFQNKYAAQVQAYAAALVSLGIKVKSAFLLLARTGTHVEIPCS